MSPTHWETLGATHPDALGDARLQLHHAALVVASLGATLLPPQPDDSHPNLGWQPDQQALAGRVAPGARPQQAALCVASLELALFAGDGSTASRMPLEGHTLEEAQAWLAEAVGQPLTRPDYEIPAHPVGSGRPFSFDEPGAFAELQRLYANADLELQRIARTTPGASEVRCWPHHFDIATLIVLDSDDAGAVTRSVGVGLSPGDGSYAEPYWYVSPWPYPENPALPELPAGGHWHTEGFTAAVLTTTALLGSGHEAGQQARTRDFLTSAIAAGQQLLGSGG